MDCMQSLPGSPPPPCSWAQQHHVSSVCVRVITPLAALMTRAGNEVPHEGPNFVCMLISLPCSNIKIGVRLRQTYVLQHILNLRVRRY